MPDVLIGILAGLILGGSVCAVAVDARGRLRSPRRHIMAPPAAVAVPEPVPLALTATVHDEPALEVLDLDGIDALIESLTRDLRPVVAELPAAPVEICPVLPPIETHDAEVVDEQERPRLGPPAPLTVAEVYRITVLPRRESQPATVLAPAWIAGSFGYDPTLDDTTSIRPVRDETRAVAS